MTSLGIEGSLDKASQVAFYTELARVLMPEGIYLTAFYNYPYMSSESMAEITQTSKATLADMICDTVSGGANITERLDTDETDTLLAELGLQKEYYSDTSKDGKDQVVLQFITKVPNFSDV